MREKIIMALAVVHKKGSCEATGIYREKGRFLNLSSTKTKNKANSLDRGSNRK